MMEIIRCTNCSGTHIGLDATHVDVTLKRSEYCNHCHKMDTKEEHYFFCSTLCHHQFMQKVINGEAEFKMREWKIVDGVHKFE